MMMANLNCNWIQHYQCHCWLESGFYKWFTYRGLDDDGKSKLQLDPTLPMSMLVGIRFYKWFTEGWMMMANHNCNWIQHYQCQCWLESGFTSGLQMAGRWEF